MKNEALSYNKWQSVIAWVLSLALLSLLLSYLFFVGASILYLAERENSQKRITQLEVRSSELVTEYLDKTQAIDLELAASFGLEDISEERFFAARQPETVTLSRINNEIQ